ncbi:mirror-image polydactyly gene 1 protein isoform X2 [Tachysurus fulvidraco]|uniref:mirror-image polydactyly gene 1 protein isoform X2 n=1 Tax=Tachysurus fulvidraco TaxID=1234273 RepID=UPI000F4D2E3C|nr:mirror-image polydactyly gene 1 protein isoform X2 [Tachysurus fulvidraco]
MNCHSMAHDVKTAILRAKHKISSLENELCAKRESCSEGEEENHQMPWKLKQELKDSLVDMYKANPKVNEELKQRLPSPIKRHCSETTPQSGFCGLASSPDISQTTSETAAPEKKLKGPDSPRAREDPVHGPFPPPPPPLPAPARNIEEVVMLPLQSAPTQHSLNEEETDTRATSKSPCVTPDPTAPRRITDKCNGNSKVSHDTKRQVPFLDKEKNIAFLLKELDSLRDLNKKLHEKLALKEKELETMRLDSQLQEEKLGADACERAAALVEEIYKAQRERDQAVMARLRLANEERDEALLRAKKLQEAALELENINPEETDMDLEELLNRVSSADSALSIEQSGMAILERIQRARERRSKITSEEMKAVIEERDNAFTRCQRLDQELLHTRELSQANTRHLNMANNQEQVHKIQLELEAVQRERNIAMEHGHKLDEELQAMRRCHSAQQSQTDESSGKETPCLSSPTYVKESSTAQGQNLLSHVQHLTSELQSTQTQLRVAQESEREANEKVHKLERLVDVLRKKVGTGSVRTVI